MKNREYWRKRAEILQDSLLNTADEFYTDLERQYKLSLNNIEKEIVLWYKRFAKNNQITYIEAKRMLQYKELIELRWDIEEYIKYGKENSINTNWIKELENASSKAHITKLECLKLKLQNEIEVLISKQSNTTTDILNDIYTEGYYKTLYDMQQGLGLAFSINSFKENEIQSILSTPWTVDNITFSDRWGKYRVELIDTLRTELTQNLILGKKPDETINLIAKKFNKTKNQVGNLVMTESAYFSSLSRNDCYNDLGIEEFEIVATLDMKTSKICRELDGMHFSLKEYEVGVTANPFHPFCRTTTCPYFNDEFTVDEKRISRLNGKVQYVSSNLKYNEWKDKYVK